MKPPLRVAFLWHMHQPMYRDPAAGKFLLPWLRLHALKDYWGMAHLIEEFPGLRVTFNLVPALLLQLDLYLRGEKDQFQELAEKPAAALEPPEIDFLMHNFFAANLERQIRPQPRYHFLYQKGQEYLKNQGQQNGRSTFTVEELRDLQIWHTLSYFDREWRKTDARIGELMARGGRFSEADKSILAAAERDLFAQIVPLYRRLFLAGQIEISVSPYYHPILPLLLDPALGRLANPSLPAYDLAFNWQQDARLQLTRARTYAENIFGGKIAGVWPSEGSLSAEVLDLLATLGTVWTAADEMNLSRSLGIAAERDAHHALRHPEAFYRPYHWRDGSMRIFFRDHYLSDLIGFQYQHLSAADAAADFVGRLRGIAAAGIPPDAVVPVILDGENAWEYYANDGRDFLAELYRRIGADKRLRTVTFSEASQGDAEPLEALWIHI